MTREDLLRVMAEHGFDNDGENPHSWRCAYYREAFAHGKVEKPYCTCPQDLADAILALVPILEDELEVVDE